MHHLHTVSIVGSSPTVTTKLLGNRLARPKATVFEIVIVGSNPTSPAKYIAIV